MKNLDTSKKGKEVGNWNRMMALQLWCVAYVWTEYFGAFIHIRVELWVTNEASRHKPNPATKELLQELQCIEFGMREQFIKKRGILFAFLNK